MPVLRGIIGLFALLLTGAAGAQPAADYPNRPIRLLLPFAPGGGTDSLAGIVNAELPARLGQNIIVEHRGGGGSMIGTSQVVKSPADGYNLLLTSSTLTVAPSLYKNVPYNTLEDLEPISLLAAGPVILVVHRSTGVTTVPELIARAKKEPGKLRFGSGGNGSPPHLGLELFQSITGTRMVHVPYKGAGPATIDLVGGHLDMMFAGISQARQHIEAGTLVALAVTGDARSKAVPNVPTFGELGLPGVDAPTTWGVLAPKGTPKEIIERLSRELATVIRLPKVVERLEELGFVPVGSTPAAYRDKIREDVEKWGKVIRQVGITAE